MKISLIVWIALTWLVSPQAKAQALPALPETPKEVGGVRFFHEDNLGWGDHWELFPLDTATGRRERGTLTFSQQVGIEMGGRARVFGLLNMSFHDTKSVRKITSWLSDNDDSLAALKWLLLWWLVPLGFFADAHCLAGPGFSFDVNTEYPRFFFEAGMGLSGIRLAKNRDYVLGGSFFAGVGLRLTGSLSLLLRAVYAPPFMAFSAVNETDVHAISTSLLFGFSR
ncbi:MAG: hypothetical protein GYA21_05590 [Myxococcales bacterium]|nr:hypothetical protein [Myxococcales bacterium]